MERNTAIVLSIFAIGYFSVLIFSTGAFSFEFPLNASGEESVGVNHIVELQDGIVILSSATTTHAGCILDWCPTPYEPSVKIGEIVTSEDGTHCWEVTEKLDSYYYKLTECPANV